MRISRERRARLSSSQANGCSSTLRASRNEVTASSPDTGSSLDEIEIGDQGTHLGHVFNANPRDFARRDDLHMTGAPVAPLWSTTTLTR